MQMEFIGVRPGAKSPQGLTEQGGGHTGEETGASDEKLALIQVIPLNFAAPGTLVG